MLAAEMVGPSGSVVGIDPSADAVAAAEGRVLDRGLQQIRFEVSSAEAFSSTERFDAVIGRYVLIHQAIPADLVRAARRHVRPGGVIGFHEISCYRGFQCLPSSDLFEETDRLLKIGMAMFPSHDAAGRLVEIFQQADLPHPRLFAEVPVGGGSDSDLYAWMAETLRSLLPTLVKHGVVTEEDGLISTLEDRLRAEAVKLRSQVEIPIQVCAWARL
jgi:SAM-dependent methyltransferase